MSAQQKYENPKISVGDSAPNFNMPISESESITLDSFKGKNLVLYFYPKDDTPGCTTEAIDFTARIKDFDAANTAVVGVSKDNLKKHAKFIDKHDLKVVLASDEEGLACDAYGVWVEKSMYGKKYMGIQRATFLIDGSGKIAHIWPKVSVKGHADEVLEAAKNL